MMSLSQVDKTTSLFKVIEDALQEVNGLEERNSEMKNALTELQSDINNLNHSVASLRAKENSYSEIEEANASEHAHHAKNKILLYQLQISSDITAKLSSKIESNLHSGLLHDAFQSSISEIKKKLASLSMIVQELSSETSKPIEVVSKGVDATQTCENYKLFDDSNSLNPLSDASFLNVSVDKIQLHLNDALEKNIRWQNYNVEREQYVTLLLSKYNQNCADLQNLREKMSEITSQPDKLATEQRRYFDKLLVGARQELEHQRNQNLLKVTELTILKEKHQDETSRLESSVEKWRKRYEEQRETIAALNANYENEKRRSSSNAFDKKEKQSQIQLLQRQVQIFSEDFRAERKEKNLALDEVNLLKCKLNQLQKEFEKVKKPPILHKKVSTTDISQESSEHNIKSQKQSSLSGKNSGETTPSSKPSIQFNHLKDRANITVRRQSPTIKSKSLTYKQKQKQKEIINTSNTFFDISDASDFSIPLVQSVSEKHLSDNDSILQCPSCGKKYNINEHVFLLEHIDICGD